MAKIKTKTIYTTAYSGKNKYGLRPAHVLDIISKQSADLLNFYDMQQKYADILKPNGSNFQYWISWEDTDNFKKGFTNTGRKRYKSAGVP